MTLKFRAYDKKYKSYSEEPYYRLLIAYNGQVYNSENDIWYKPNERYIIEFFTGHKDKNGKEIYAGDILINNIDDYKRVVDWNYEYACFTLRHLIEEPYCEPLSLAEGNFEIIGNEYEK